ncbi:hypothetical protein AcetOrient_orf00102 [Acetobacter orientalis]|uniref:Uncharacterized protein n=1 Tax=Acetobacter orientalis TaxID=146474 RepID=A0A2Z5ZDD8_9PROT|nr:hypothetical protein AcetOrient_orf00102 [Acetobacter orientalis]
MGAKSCPYRLTTVNNPSAAIFEKLISRSSLLSAVRAGRR